MRSLNAEERYVLEAATSGQDYFDRDVSQKTIVSLTSRGLLYESDRIADGDEGDWVEYRATSVGCLVLRCCKMLDAIF